MMIVVVNYNSTTNDDDLLDQSPLSSLSQNQYSSMKFDDVEPIELVSSAQLTLKLDPKRTMTGETIISNDEDEGFVVYEPPYDDKELLEFDYNLEDPDASEDPSANTAGPTGASLNSQASSLRFPICNSRHLFRLLLLLLLSLCYHSSPW